MSEYISRVILSDLIRSVQRSSIVISIVERVLRGVFMIPLLALFHSDKGELGLGKRPLLLRLSKSCSRLNSTASVILKYLLTCR